MACGRDTRLEDVRIREVEALKNKLALASASSAAVVSPPGPAAKKIKLATFVDQTNDLEVAELGEKEVMDAYLRFKKSTGGMPDQSEELTLEQLTSLHALLHGAGPPYVDFAVWGPFGHRIAKKNRLQGVVLGPKGELVPTEVYGPSNYHDWEQCFRVWRSGMLMLGAACTATLDAYGRLVYRYYARYGQTVWLLLYQADVRARLEQLERVRRRGLAAATAGLPTGEVPFDSKVPWEWSLRELVDDNKFWRSEFEEPAMLVLSRASKLNNMVDGDAPVQQSGPAAPEAPNAHGPPRRPRHRGNRGGGGDINDDKGQRKLPVCGPFQAGRCDKNGANGTCGYNPDKAHRCVRCDSTEHGADKCHLPDPRKGKGKGKKGKGKTQY